MHCIFQAPRSYSGIYEGLSNGIAFDQTAGLVALCTENYCIQFYSLYDDRGISEVKIFLFLLLQSYWTFSLMDASGTNEMVYGSLLHVCYIMGYKFLYHNFLVFDTSLQLKISKYGLFLA